MDTEALPQVDTGLRAVIVPAYFHQLSVEESLIRHQLGVSGGLLQAGQVLAFFDGDLGKAQRILGNCIIGVTNQPPLLDQLRKRMSHGSDAFMDEVKLKIDSIQNLGSISRLQKKLVKPVLH